MLLGAAIITISGIVPARADGNGKNDSCATDSIRTVTEVTLEMAPHKVIAYYFHGNVRCATCRRIETYTKEAIDSAFATDLVDGGLEWRVINTDSAHYAHFVDDYKLYTRSVILSDLHEGKEARWKNLEKVWTLSNDKTEFSKYIQTEVKVFLDTAQ